MGFLPSWLNPFDFVIALALVGGVALGFVRGLVRMTLSLAVLYVAAALATAFHPRVGAWISSTSGLPLAVALGMGFLLILALAAILLNFLLHRAYRDTELPGLRQVDHRSRPPLDALEHAALDAHAAVVAGVEALLQVHGGNLGGNVDRSRQDLEPLRRRVE